MSKKTIVLASTSIYRRELLERICEDFAVVAPNIDETSKSTETPAERAMRLSIEKARAGALSTSGDIFIGSDQVAECDNQILHKPGTKENAVAQLMFSSGKLAKFHTGVCVFNQTTDSHDCAVVTTEVKFRSLTIEEIKRYVDREDVLGCAGSAKSEGLGISLLNSIHGSDPTALVGLPLITLTRMLRDVGVSLP